MKDGTLLSFYNSETVSTNIWRKETIFGFRHLEFEGVSMQREIEKAVRIHGSGTLRSLGQSYKFRIHLIVGDS